MTSINPDIRQALFDLDIGLALFDLGYRTDPVGSGHRAGPDRPLVRRIASCGPPFLSYNLCPATPFARKHRVKPGKKAPLRIRVLSEGAFLGEI